MIAAIDVHYRNDGSAKAAAVIFCGFSDQKEYRTYTMEMQKAEDYILGQFYRRELPCILSIIGIIEEPIDAIIIDGYVNLGERPGLGMHLCKAFDGKIKVIGVAKKFFPGSCGIEILRGNSRQPLYITSAGIKPYQAAELIRQMHGKYRLPVLLKQADVISRSEIKMNPYLTDR
jgi:deoxyribonuclease V